MARREKKPVHKVVMTEGKRNIIQQLLQEYDIETEYSRAVTPQIRQAGNRLSGLAETAYASLLA